MEAEGIEWQSISTAMPKRRRVLSSRFARARVEGAIEPLDALECSPDGQPLAVDLLGVGDDAGDSAQPADHAGRLGVGELRQAADEKLGIELIGLAIDVQVGARKARGDKGCAELDNRREQLIDDSSLPTCAGCAHPACEVSRNALG